VELIAWTVVSEITAFSCKFDVLNSLEFVRVFDIYFILMSKSFIS
jgi:hypothetical protein